jgi:preprotein translocase subunit SecD
VLQVSLWVRIVTAIILIGGILIALPNALSDKVLAKFPKWLPSQTVNLGLDLQGGSYLLLQVDFDQVTRDRAEAMARNETRAVALDWDTQIDGETTQVTLTTTMRLKMSMMT